MTVYLVGAGPGDPGLLTVRGAELLNEADVVVYDRLSVATLLDQAPPHALRINVGKAPGNAMVPQEGINHLLVEHGQTGAQVVRLKGGDPFVFARGGEEAAALQAAGVPFEVVPGISSAIAAPAYAGIPVTLRHSSELFTVITGHEDPDKGGELDWEAVARLGGTIVILMGVARLEKIVRRLLDGGLDQDTPLAVVRWGTRPEQHTVRATLGSILDRRAELSSPSVIVVGRVAATDLSWFERRPLFGKRVVVTRTRAQASSLVRMLRLEGAEVVEMPLIAIEAPTDGGAALHVSVSNCRNFDWVVFTSPNGADRFLSQLRDVRQLGDTKVAVIGPGTAAICREHRLVPDLMPERFVAEGLLDVFPRPPEAITAGRPGGMSRVLLPRAEQARDVLPDGLRAMGWEVEVVAAYRTVPVPPTEEQRAALTHAHIITFTSSSTVDHFVRAFGNGGDAVAAAPPIVASIGPITSTTARSHGLDVHLEALDHSIPGLVRSLVEHHSGEGR